MKRMGVNYLTSSICIRIHNNVV